MGDRIRRARFHEPEDIIEEMFRQLPCPLEHPSDRAIWDRIVSISRAIIAKFNKDAESRSSEDPDLEYILNYTKMVEKGDMTVQRFYNQLANLAVSKVISENDGSEKARHLRYYGWLALGKKDENSPFFLSDARQPHADHTSHATLPTALASCSQCGKKSAKLHCQMCAATVHGSPFPFASYCSESCQAMHDKHKEDCKIFKELWQRTEIFQRLLGHYYTTVYEVDVFKITEKDGWYLCEDDPDARKDWKPWFRSFPSHLCSSQDMAEAVMFAFRCSDTAIHGCLIELIFRPICEKIEKVDYFPRNIHRTVQYHRRGMSEFNSLCSHQILRLTLPSGHQLALDPSAAQYGWHENLAPWEQYTQHRADGAMHIAVLEPLEGLQKLFVNQGQRPNKRHRTEEAISKYVRRVSAELLAESLSTAPSCEGVDGLAGLFAEDHVGGWQTDADGLIQQVKISFTSKAEDLAQHLLQIDAVKGRTQGEIAARNTTADEITPQELAVLVSECDLAYENEVGDTQPEQSES